MPVLDSLTSYTLNDFPYVNKIADMEIEAGLSGYCRYVQKNKAVFISIHRDPSSKNILIGLGSMSDGLSGALKGPLTYPPPAGWITPDQLPIGSMPE